MGDRQLASRRHFSVHGAGQRIVIRTPQLSLAEMLRSRALVKAQAIAAVVKISGQVWCAANDGSGAERVFGRASRHGGWVRGTTRALNRDRNEDGNWD
jgi:hypothetical protein